MSALETIAAIRFGTGLSPQGGGAAPEAILSALSGPDAVARAFPMDSYAERTVAALAYRDAQRARRDSDEAEQAFRAIRRQMRADITLQLATTLARGVAASPAQGLRERLAWFWADHFTTVGERAFMRGGIAAYVDEAIRPHVAGHFGDMLEAAILHPVMILYLDQERSIGPNSVVGQRRGGDLNENLARELLELHTLGAGSGYSQDDVRQMAELLTGLGLDRDGQLAFRPNNAEPGGETILGTLYGSEAQARLADIRAALRDLAVRPETARHLSGKLADHFLSDRPDPGLVEAMAERWLETGGDLMAVMRTMLDDPAAWDPAPGRVKRPLHYLVSALRALAVPAATIATARPERITRLALRPMQVMGQPWQGASGPDGFFDDDREWIRPQVLAARIGWAMAAPSDLLRILPDPRDFVTTALGDFADDALRRAAARAETRAEGLGIILSAPAFQRS